MDIDSLASEFGSKGKSAPDNSTAGGVDVHGLAAEFGSEEKAKEVEKDYGNRILVTRGKQVGEPGYQYTPQSFPSTDTGPQGFSADVKNLREGIQNLPSNIGSSIVEDFKGGTKLAGEGINDIANNRPATGIAKTIGGGLMAAASPISGTIKEAVEKPVTALTGNPDIGDRAGLVAGAVLPVSKIADAAKASIPANKAFRTLIDTIGPENVSNVAKEMRANPRLTPADLSPATQQTVQKLFVTEGDKTKNYLAQSVQGRLATAKDAVENAMTGAMGQTVDPVQKMQALSNSIKAVGAKEINPVLKATKPVDLSPVVEHIDNILKPGAMSVISNPENLLPYDKVQKLMQGYRDVMTNDKTVLTNPDVLNKLQSGMRRNADNLMRTMDPEAKAMGYALHQLRQKVIDAVGKAGPQTVDKEGKAVSSYRAALGKYRDENHIADAYEEGHDSILTNSKKLMDRPEFFQKKVEAYSPEEKESAREGARLAIDTQINGFKHGARRGTDVSQVEFNKDRIIALFGKDKADELFKKLEHERMIADTNSKLVQGSQTAMRSGADARIAMPASSKLQNVAPYAAEALGALTTGYPGAGTLGYLGLKGAASIKDKIATSMAKEHNATFAKLALPTEGLKREELIRSLEAVANRQKPSILQRANSIARLVGP